MLANGRAATIASRGLLAQPANVIEPQTHTVAIFNGAKPLRFLHIHGQKMQAVALGVFHQSRRMIKPHGLLIQNRRGERRQVMALQISAGIGDQSETRGVRFGKSVQRK